MKKISYIILIATMLALPGLARAQSTVLSDSLTIFGDNTILPTADLQIVAAKLINAGLDLAGLVLVTVFLYGGLTWMLALGDDTKVQKAKGAMIQGVIGLLIIVMSYSLVSWVFAALNSATGS